MLHIKRHISIGPIKSIKCGMYMSPCSVNVSYVFDIHNIDSMVFTINRGMCVLKIINFGQSVLKIPAKNYVGLSNFGPPCRIHWHIGIITSSGRSNLPGAPSFKCLHKFMQFMKTTIEVWMLKCSELITSFLSEWVSSLLTAHQHIIGLAYSVPWKGG